jgi:hypothetical protein
MLLKFFNKFFLNVLLYLLLFIRQNKIFYGVFTGFILITFKKMFIVAILFTTVYVLNYFRHIILCGINNIYNIFNQCKDHIYLKKIHYLNKKINNIVENINVLKEKHDNLKSNILKDKHNNFVPNKNIPVNSYLQINEKDNCYNDILLNVSNFNNIELLCHIIDKNNLSIIWTSQEHEIEITQLKGEIIIKNFDKNISDCVGNINIYNHKDNTIYTGIVNINNNKINCTLSSRPLIPIGIKLNATICLNIHVIIDKNIHFSPISTNIYNTVETYINESEEKITGN